MIDKLRIIWLKIGNFLLWALVAILLAFIGYMLYSHRKVITAMLAGEELPECDGDSCCPFWER